MTSNLQLFFSTEALFLGNCVWTFVSSFSPEKIWGAKIYAAIYKFFLLLLTYRLCAVCQCCACGRHIAY